MKSLMIFTGIFLFICIIITAAYTPESTALPSEEVSEVQEISLKQSEPPEEKYRLGIYERKVAAFESGNEKPIYISDVYINSLPQADRELLEKGIVASDRKSLNRMIEDYCS